MIVEALSDPTKPSWRTGKHFRDGSAVDDAISSAVRSDALKKAKEEADIRCRNTPKATEDLQLL